MTCSESSSRALQHCNTSNRFASAAGFYASQSMIIRCIHLHLSLPVNRFPPTVQVRDTVTSRATYVLEQPQSR